MYVFDAIQDRFEQAEHKLFGTVLGSDTDVDTLPVKEDVCRYICLDAFYQAIPGLDLILTDTGFGIVNNQNISPASRDRVESLRVQIQREADYTLDCIIEGMTGDDAWSSSVCARLVISSLYYTGAHVRDLQADRQPSVLICSNFVRKSARLKNISGARYPQFYLIICLNKSGISLWLKLRYRWFVRSVGR